MTSDERLIETLRNIKKHCTMVGFDEQTQELSDEIEDCKQCKFYYAKGNKTNCQLAELFRVLSTSPNKWNVSKIKKIVKG